MLLILPELPSHSLVLGMNDDRLVGEKVLTCNHGNSSRELGWFSSVAPTCQFKNSAQDIRTFLFLCLIISLVVLNI